MMYDIQCEWLKKQNKNKQKKTIYVNMVIFFH